MTSDPPQFLVVGSPRSGTTLVQRLASELPGVRVTPETHFYSLFFEQELSRLEFPIGADAVSGLIERYRQLPALLDLEIDDAAVLRRIGDRCECPSALFAAIVGALAPDAETVGEKTPNHLRWWRPIEAANPGTKFVVVVRDPRAVVSSTLEAPFGMATAALVAAAWVQDVREVGELRRTLPPEQVLVLSYEDVVADPASARRRIATLLGVADDGLAQPVAGRLFPAGEDAWKARALGTVDAGRATAWRERLTEVQVRHVEAVAGPAMRSLGYQPDRRSSRWALPLDVRASLLRHRLGRSAERRRIRDARLGAPDQGTR